MFWYKKIPVQGILLGFYRTKLDYCVENQQPMQRAFLRNKILEKSTE